MPDFEIQISDRQSFLSVNPKRLGEVIERVVREEQIASAVISLALVDDSEIRQINRDFLGHDFATDVISFLLEQGPMSPVPQTALVGDQIGVEDLRTIEAELVLSAETALREAPSHGWSAENEVILYVVHGLLHLCGYDDLTDEARPLMRCRERQMLAMWNLTPIGLEA